MAYGRYENLRSEGDSGQGDATGQRPSINPRAPVSLAMALNRTALSWMLLRTLRKLPVKPPVNRHYDASRPHHLPTGFRNRAPELHPTPEELAQSRAAFERARQTPISEQSATGPAAKPDWTLLADPGATAVTWLGHSTVLFQLHGRTVLTDPMFSQRASPLPFAGPKRVHPPGIPLHRLPHIDVVVLSHSHYDHADVPSLRALTKQSGGPPVFALPLGMDQWFQRRVHRAAPIQMFDWWQVAELAKVRVTFTPTHHWSARTLWDRNLTLWGGWVLQHAGVTTYFSGDLAYSDDIRETGERLGPFDLAAIAVGHYEPRWVMKNHHLTPEEAVKAHFDLRAARSLAIHHGTFAKLTAEPLHQPVLDLVEARRSHGLTENQFFFLRHGQTERFGEANTD